MYISIMVRSPCSSTAASRIVVLATDEERCTTLSQDSGTGRPEGRYPARVVSASRQAHSPTNLHTFLRRAKEAFVLAPLSAHRARHSTPPARRAPS